MLLTALYLICCWLPSIWNAVDCLPCGALLTALILECCWLPSVWFAVDCPLFDMLYTFRYFFQPFLVFCWPDCTSSTQWGTEMWPTRFAMTLAQKFSPVKLFFLAYLVNWRDGLTWMLWRWIKLNPYFNVCPLWISKLLTGFLFWYSKHFSRVFEFKKILTETFSQLTCH